MLSFLINNLYSKLYFYIKPLVTSPWRSVPHPVGISTFFLLATSIFPRATVVVAISSAKLSPEFPGATKEIGFVPKVACGQDSKFYYFISKSLTQK